jgi:Putative MetA-pathway of phenol degradation
MKKVAYAFFACMACEFNAVAVVNDIFPTDYIALPSGTKVVTLYHYSKEMTGPYLHKSKQTNDHVSVELDFIRASVFMEAFGYRSALTVAGGYVNEEGKGSVLSALGETDGIADTRVNYTIWPISVSGGEQVALTTTVSMPTGNYNADRQLNIGENKYKYILTAGWVKPVANGVAVDSILEYAKYGVNNDYYGSAKHQKLEQTDSISLTSYLRYRSVKQVETYFGYQINRGGATTLNDIKQHNAPNSQKQMVGVAWTFISKNTFSIRYGRENVIENGFRINNELAARLLMVF